MMDLKRRGWLVIQPCKKLSSIGFKERNTVLILITLSINAMIMKKWKKISSFMNSLNWTNKKSNSHLYSKYCVQVAIRTFTSI